MRMPRQQIIARWMAVLLPMLLWAQVAFAHAQQGEAKGFFTGFLISPEDLAPVLALAFLAGLRGASYGRRTLFVLPAAWLLGGLIGLAATSASAHPVVSAF